VSKRRSTIELVAASAGRSANRPLTHLAIVCARLCTNLECRRRGICSSPALDCKLRPLADAYDWDYGWFNSQRKPMYGVPEGTWMPPIRCGTPEFRAQQGRQLMEDRASLRTKLHPDPDPE
jgi:hypothetical protein